MRKSKSKLTGSGECRKRLRSTECSDMHNTEGKISNGQTAHISDTDLKPSKTIQFSERLEKTLALFEALQSSEIIEIPSSGKMIH